MNTNEYAAENAANENSHLVELSGSDYEIKDGEPDIAGWDVKNEQGQKIGVVDDLLFDPENRKVRYIIVDLDNNDLGLALDKKVLVPIGVADLYDSTYNADEQEAIQADKAGRYDDDDEDVIKPAGVDTINTGENQYGFFEGNSADNTGLEEGAETDVYDPAYDGGDVVIIPATIAQLKELPVYEKSNISPESELTIRRLFNTPGSAGTIDYNRNDFYDHEHFDDRKFYDRGATTDSIVPENDIEEENGGGAL